MTTQTASRRVGSRTGGSLRAVLAWTTAALLLTPIYWMLVTAILPSDLVVSRTPPYVPPIDAIDFSSFVRIFTDRPVPTWLVNSVVVTVVAVLTTVVVAIPAGYRMSRSSGRLKAALGYLLLISLALPGTLLIIPIFFGYARLGILNQPALVGLAVASTTTPFSTWMAKTYFDSVPRSLDESALVDGASEFTAFRRVILPLIGPATAAIVAYSVIWAWADFLYARTLLQRDADWTLSVGIVSFIGDYSADWQGLMATGLVAAVPLLVIFAALQNFLVEGMTKGSVK